MEALPDSQGAALQPHPSSAQVVAFPPARSELHPHKIARDLKGTTATIRSPQQIDRDKATLYGATTVRRSGLSTVGGKSKKYGSSTSPATKSVLPTIPSRPKSQASMRHTALAETFEDIKAIATPIPLSRKKTIARPKLGPDNWTPITAKIVMDTSPPRMKIHRQRRATILPKTGTPSLFGQAHSPPNQKYKDLVYDSKFNSLSPPARSFLQAKSPQTPLAKSPAEDSSPKVAPVLQKCRSVISLPNRQLKRPIRSLSKTVRWDPSIVIASPEVQSTSEAVPKVDQSKLQNSCTPRKDSEHRLDVDDYVESIKEWGLTDQSKLVRLIQALNQLQLEMEDNEEKVGKVKSNSNDDEEVLITTVKSMDPRVPEFESTNTIETRSKPGIVGVLEGCRLVKPDLGPFSESDFNKENIPEFTIRQPNMSRDSESPKRRKRITILDDHNSSGRQVDSFADWYAEMQLIEFVKKYPLTGKRISAIRQASSDSARVAKASGDIRMVPRVCDSAAEGFKSGNTRGENVPGVGELDRLRMRGKETEITKNERWQFKGGRRSVHSRRRNLPLMTDPAARKDASNIQQQLEVLLLKERERKALECLPDMAQMPFSYPDYSPAARNEHLCYGGLNYDESYTTSTPLWIPSDRLKL